MGRIPPKRLGSKSPATSSSIFLSPSAVWIVVPFRKHIGPLGPGGGGGGPPPGGPGGGGGPGGAAEVGVTPAKIADAAIAPIFIRLRRDLRIPLSFSRSSMGPLYLDASTGSARCEGRDPATCKN